jgi:hypothetical protein
MGTQTRLLLSLLSLVLALGALLVVLLLLRSTFG